MLAANALLTELSIAETEMSDRNVLIQRTTDISLPKISEQALRPLGPEIGMEVDAAGHTRLRRAS